MALPFDLVDEPWLDVRPLDGDRPLPLGLRETLLRAHELADLIVELPTLKPALFRQVLLPVVLDALGGPTDPDDWITLLRAGRFNQEQETKISEYLDKHMELFDLFHPVHPFAQVAGLRTAKEETKGSSLLVATSSSGNNVPLFASRTDADPLELTPAQAARWTLHVHCWDTAAIKTGVVGDPQAKAGKTTGNPTGPLGQLGVVMPLGRTLFDTLILNLPTDYTPRSDDQPQWLRRSAEGPMPIGTPEWQTRAAKGFLDLWTWQSRRIRLVPSETAGGTRITRVVIAAGDRLERTPDIEPHTAWKVDSPAKAKKSGITGSRPHRHQPGKAAWRGMDAILESDRRQTDAGKTRDGFEPSRLLVQLRRFRGQLPARYPLQVELTGIAYGTQSAVIDDVLFDAIPLPLTALTHDGLMRETLLEVADQAEKLAQALNHLSADVRRAAGAEPIPWDKGQRPGEVLLHVLDPLVRRLLSDLRPAGEDLDAVEELSMAFEREAVRRTWRVAADVLRTATPGTFAGRTIDKDGKKHSYRQATAEDSFRKRVDATLTRVAEARRASQAETAAQDTAEAQQTGD